MTIKLTARYCPTGYVYSESSKKCVQEYEFGKVSTGEFDGTKWTTEYLFLNYKEQSSPLIECEVYKKTNGKYTLLSKGEVKGYGHCFVLVKHDEEDELVARAYYYNKFKKKVYTPYISEKSNSSFELD